MRFRKKPVEIDAWQFDAPEFMTQPKWLNDCIVAGKVTYRPTTATASAAYLIKTLEGTMRADPGDWIILGIKGEVYPVKPEIFAATYEPVEA